MGDVKFDESHSAYELNLAFVPFSTCKLSLKYVPFSLPNFFVGDPILVSSSDDDNEDENPPPPAHLPPDEFVIGRFSSPFLSCTEGLFPFPYVDLPSLFYESRAKNIHFSTYTLPISYARCVYIGYSTTAHVHQDLCQKIQK